MIELAQDRAAHQATETDVQDRRAFCSCVAGLSRIVRSYPKLLGLGTWLVSFLAVVTALVLADLGAPVWIFLLLGLWLCTLGLPTLLAVLIVASVWGRLPWIGTPPLAVALTPRTETCVGQGR